MKKILLATLVVLASEETIADYAGQLSVNRIRVHAGEVFFGTSRKPNNTCSNWGEYFKFVHTTDSGRSYLSTLLSAKASGKMVDVWYSASHAPNTTESNGCNSSSVSVLSGIAIR